MQSNVWIELHTFNPIIECVQGLLPAAPCTLGEGFELPPPKVQGQSLEGASCRATSACLASSIGGRAPL